MEFATIDTYNFLYTCIYINESCNLCIAIFLSFLKRSRIISDFWRKDLEILEEVRIP